MLPGDPSLKRLRATLGVARHDLEGHAMSRLHTENHLINRVGWLRAAVLGANDGIISTASLMVGVATAASSSSEVLLTGIAGLVAGSMSMAAGEYVSVSSQADTERADLGRERQELATDRDAELQELATIYIGRGVEAPLARQVAEQLMAKDALGAHARDELGISEAISANPIQAALTSAATFAAGAALPILAALVAPGPPWCCPSSECRWSCWRLLGAIGAKAGGADLLKPTVRVAFWGAFAMGVTAAIGALIGKSCVSSANPFDKGGPKRRAPTAESTEPRSRQCLQNRQFAAETPVRRTNGRRRSRSR